MRCSLNVTLYIWTHNGFFHLLFCDCFVTTSMPRQYFAKFVIDKNKTKNIFQNSLSLCLSLLTFGSLPNQFNTLNLHYIFQTNEYVWDHPTIRKNANDLYPHVIFRRRQPIYMMSELTVNEMDFLIVSLYNVFFILFIIKLTHIPHSTINFMIIFDPMEYMPSNSNMRIRPIHLSGREGQKFVNNRKYPETVTDIQYICKCACCMSK